VTVRDEAVVLHSANHDRRRYAEFVGEVWNIRDRQALQLFIV